MNETSAFRVEHDLLGDREVPADSLYGIHTVRALENFPLSGRPVHPELVHAFGAVKLACLRANRELGKWKSDEKKADAIEQACGERWRRAGLTHRLWSMRFRAEPGRPPT